MINNFENEVKKVAAYCRVSTDNLDQANSLESQQRYFNEYIKRNPLWELYEIYVDEGISGTSTKKRASFNRMIEDAKAKKFDLIITKEISRFARNTLDSIGYTRELKSYGIGVIFMNDNINTLDADAELRLTIMSSIAQEESRKTSDRVKWGQRRMMEQGVVFGRDMLGYDVRDGKLYINKEGAETVRLIYHKFLNEGKGTHVIAKELRDAGIKTSTYMKDWSYTVILRILKNEKYCGDLIQQKTYTPDYLSHNKKYNKGEVEYVTIRNHHEPIISREIFEAIQRELERRKMLHGAKNGFANRYALSGKIICAECGSTFIHRKKTSSNGNQNESWVCIQNQKYGKERINKNNEKVGCSNVSINEKDIRSILQHIILDIMKDRNKILESVLQIVSDVLKSDKEKDNIIYFENELKKIENKKQKLLDMCLSGDIETTDYRKACERLKTEYEKISEKLQKEKAHSSMLEDKEKIISEIKAYVNSIIIGEEWSDTFYRNIVDKIVVNKNREIDIHLRFIPDKWSAKILCGKAEIDRYNEKFSNQGTSQPGSSTGQITFSANVSYLGEVQDSKAVTNWKVSDTVSEDTVITDNGDGTATLIISPFETEDLIITAEYELDWVGATNGINTAKVIIDNGPPIGTMLLVNTADNDHTAEYTPGEETTFELKMYYFPEYTGAVQPLEDAYTGAEAEVLATKLRFYQSNVEFGETPIDGVELTQNPDDPSLVTVNISDTVTGYIYIMFDQDNALTGSMWILDSTIERDY